jgi:hypothetical protein
MSFARSGRRQSWSVQSGVVRHGLTVHQPESRKDIISLQGVPILFDGRSGQVIQRSGYTLRSLQLIRWLIIRPQVCNTVYVFPNKIQSCSISSTDGITLNGIVCMGLANLISRLMILHLHGHALRLDIIPTVAYILYHRAICFQCSPASRLAAPFT